MRAKHADVEPSSRASVIIPYSKGQLHWHVLFVCFAESIVYHFEGFGREVESEEAVPTAVATHLGAEWTFTSHRGCYQSDGSSCGIWIQVARDIFLQYVGSNEYGRGTFNAYLARVMFEKGVVDLDNVSGAAKTAARRANQTFILEQRAEMRARLVQAAINGKLAYAAAELEGFV
jgi:hypothetical protein